MTLAHLALLLAIICLVLVVWLWIDHQRRHNTIREEVDLLRSRAVRAEQDAAAKVNSMVAQAEDAANRLTGRGPGS